MLAFIWPIALVIFSNIVYQICAKSVPDSVNPFASLTVTYLIGSAISLILFYATDSDRSIMKELGAINWSSFVLGLVIVGLEVGFIYAYKAGWQVSSASVVQSSFLAVALIIVGALLYKEPVSRNKLIGIAFCLVGLVFINMK